MKTQKCKIEDNKFCTKTVAELEFLNQKLCGDEGGVWWEIELRNPETRQKKRSLKSSLDS